MKDSLVWSFIEKVGQFLTNITIAIVLSWLLPPEDFGRIAILSVLTIVCTTIVDSGLSQALIRKINSTNEDYNSVFWFNLVISLVLYVILYFSAPFIGYVFNDAKLITTSRILFIAVPLGALTIIQQTIIIKNLQFRKIAILTIIATFVSGIIGIFLALNSYGVWSLVWQIIINSFLNVIFIWFVSSWRPIFKFNFNPIKEFISFSSYILFSNLLNNIFNNLYTIIIARFYSSTKLGFYSQANRFASQPGILVDAIFSRMAYPSLAPLKDNRKSYVTSYKKLQVLVFVLMTPIMIILIFISDELINLVLGTQWLPSSDYFKVLCIATITFPIHPLAMSTLKVFGLSKLIFKLELLKKTLIIALIASFFSFGLKGLVIAQSLFFILALPINMYFSGREIGYKLVKQFKDILPVLVSNLIAISFVLFTNYIIAFEGLTKIILFPLLYALIYGIIILKLSEKWFKRMIFSKKIDL